MNPISELPDNEIRRPDNEIRRHEDININVMASALEEFNKKLEMSASYYNRHANKPGIGGHMLGVYMKTHKIEYLDEYLYPSDDIEKTFVGRRNIKEITVRPSDVHITIDNGSQIVICFNILEQKYMINGGNVLIGYVFEHEAEYKGAQQSPI